MKNINIFIIRAVLGAGFAVLLMRIFYPDKNIIYALGLGVFLVGMAYFFEYLRQKRENNP